MVTTKEYLKMKERERKKSITIICPVCNSSNINKISTANRLISTTMFGIASSKIGKQYECKNCKHKW